MASALRGAEAEAGARAYWAREAEARRRAGADVAEAMGMATQSRRASLRVGGAPGSIFSPQSPKCALWLMGDAGVSQSGGKVVGWADQSANGRNYAQPTTVAQPTLAAGSDGINGQSAILHTSGGTVTQYLRGPSFAALTTGAEIFIVIKPATASGNTTFWAFGADAYNADYYFYGGLIYTGFGTTVRPGGQTPAGGASNALQIYQVTSIPGEYTARLNGTVIYTQASNVVGWMADGSLIGGGTATGSAYAIFGGWSGKTGACTIYTPLTADERATVGEGLAGKYGGTWVS